MQPELRTNERSLLPPCLPPPPRLLLSFDVEMEGRLVYQTFAIATYYICSARHDKARHGTAQADTHAHVQMN
jgi:hypothetical protein